MQTDTNNSPKELTYNENVLSLIAFIGFSLGEETKLGGGKSEPHTLIRSHQAKKQMSIEYL